jgi:hypothetical protein
VRERPSPARHEVPEIDAAALDAAARADAALAAARALGVERWERYLARLPDRLRDDPVRGLTAAVMTIRAAYGPKDSIRDALPEAVTEPLLKTADRLLKLLRRRELESS